MNSTPEPKVTEPAPADERLAQAHEQIKRADEQLTRLTEQLAKMERDDTHPPSAAPVAQEPVPHEPGLPGSGSHKSGPQVTAEPIPGPQPPPGRRALWTRVGLPLAACIVAAVLVLQSSYGDGAKLVVARWAPQLVSTPPSPPENLPSPAPAAPATFQVAAAESAPAQALPPPRVTNPGSGRATRRRAGSTRNSSRSNPVAADDRARSRESGAQHRAAPDQPATDGQRQCQGHRGSEGEPGRDEARPRQDLRPGSGQGDTAAGATRAGLAQA